MKRFEGENLGKEENDLGQEITAGVEDTFAKVDTEGEQVKMSPEAAENKKTIRGALKAGVGDLIKAVAQNETVQKISMSPLLPMTCALVGALAIGYSWDQFMESGQAQAAVHAVTGEHLNQSAVAFNENILQMNIHQDLTNLIYNNDAGVPVDFGQLMDIHPEAAQADAQAFDAFNKGVISSIVGPLLIALGLHKSSWGFTNQKGTIMPTNQKKNKNESEL